MTTRKLPSTAFKAGQSGNPAGKPRGTRSKATVLLEAMLQENAEAITEAVIQQARGGNLLAARIILERLIPPVRERPINVELPDVASTEGVAAAQSAILKAVATGEILPAEASTLSAIVETRRRSIETQELADRIEKLEQRNGKP